MVTVFMVLLSQLSLWSLLPNSHYATFYNSWGGSRVRPKAFHTRQREDLTALLSLLAKGAINPSIAARFPLTEASAAMVLAESRTIILGTTGRTGRLVVDKALSRGHEVTAFVRTPSLPVRERLAVVVGDPRRIDDLLAVLPGHHAVISSLGNATAPADRRLVTDSASAMLTCLPCLSSLEPNTTRSAHPFLTVPSRLWSPHRRTLG
jgi:hypothetical protein